MLVKEVAVGALGAVGGGVALAAPSWAHFALICVLIGAVRTHKDTLAHVQGGHVAAGGTLVAVGAKAVLTSWVTSHILAGVVG